MKEDRQAEETTKAKGSGIEKLSQPENSHIGRTIAVMSGKGGVGKSSVSALLAVALARQNYPVEIFNKITDRFNEMAEKAN